MSYSDDFSHYLKTGEVLDSFHPQKSSGGFLLHPELIETALKDKSVAENIVRSMNLAKRLSDAIILMTDKVLLSYTTFCEIGLIYRKKAHRIEVSSDLINRIEAGEKICVYTPKRIEIR